MSTPVPLDVQRTVGRASTPPTTLKLPLELVDLIVGHICADGAFDHCDLRSLSLTAKRFTTACQKVLFEAVTLQPAKFVLDDHEQIGPDTAERFAILISESPHLAALVKRLRYRVVYGPRSDRKDVGNRKLISAISRLVNVTEIHLEGSEGDKAWGGREVTELAIFRSGYGWVPEGLDAQLLGIMQRPTTKVLTLRNIQVSVAEMAKCGGIERLGLHGSVCSSFGDWRLDDDKIEGGPIYLRHFTHSGPWSINDKILDPNDEGRYMNYFKVRWNNLETLSIPVQARHWQYSALPEVIMSTTTRLKELDMHTMDAFHPGENDATMTVPHLCPIRGLHPDSCLTLTRIRFDIGFDLMWATEWELIKDPYHGLLLDGFFEKLVNLEELSIQILIGGSKWRCMVTESMGPQWGELDKALAPKGRESPYPRLRKVELRVGNDGICDEQDNQLHRPDMQRMLDTNFDGLRALQGKGLITLHLEIVNKRDEECWRINEERSRERAVQREMRKRDVRGGAYDGHSDNGHYSSSGEDDESEDEE